MINRDTIWNETYKRDAITVEQSQIEVFTAIHHYNSGNISRLDLCAELKISATRGPAEFKAEFTMTADQMGKLADYLLAGAARVRYLQELLDEENASIESSARNAIERATEAA